MKVLHVVGVVIVLVEVSVIGDPVTVAYSVEVIVFVETSDLV